MWSGLWPLCSSSPRTMPHVTPSLPEMGVLFPYHFSTWQPRHWHPGDQVILLGLPIHPLNYLRNHCQVWSSAKWLCPIRLGTDRWWTASGRLAPKALSMPTHLVLLLLVSPFLSEIEIPACLVSKSTWVKAEFQSRSAKSNMWMLPACFFFKCCTFHNGIILLAITK